MWAGNENVIRVHASKIGEDTTTFVCTDSTLIRVVCHKVSAASVFLYYDVYACYMHHLAVDVTNRMVFVITPYTRGMMEYTNILSNQIPSYLWCERFNIIAPELTEKCKTRVRVTIFTPPEVG